MTAHAANILTGSVFKNQKPDATHFCSSLGSKWSVKQILVVNNKTANNTCKSKNQENQEKQNASNLKRFLNDDLKQMPKSKAKSKEVVKIAHQLTFLTNKKKPD